MARLKRSLPGLTEVPVLKELNDIRDHTGWDLAVEDKNNFLAVCDAVLPVGKYSVEDCLKAYGQLHLIQALGGSVSPRARFTESKSTQGKNVGKFDIEILNGSPDEERLQNMKSREMSAISMLDDNELMPTQTNQEYLDDTKNAISQFFTTGAINKIGNSGFRTKKPQGEELLSAAVQNINDLDGGFDRLSRDAIFSQPVEFGHFVPANKGGEDVSSNGRMQAMSANRAMGDRLGVAGAMSALSGDYKNMLKTVPRKAGDIFFTE